MDNPDALKQSIEKLHGCEATLRGPEIVIERFEGSTVWEGLVHVFSIDGHESATVCYAWTMPTDESEKRRTCTVIGIPPINTPADAVRAAIVAIHKKQSIK